MVLRAWCLVLGAGLVLGTWVGAGDQAQCTHQAPSTKTAPSTKHETPGTNPAPGTDSAQLIRDITALTSPAAQGRSTGSPGGRWARQWIVAQFRRIGLNPGGTAGYELPFSVTTTDVRAILPGGRPFRTTHAAANVVGRVVGRETPAVIVVTAHYDHLGVRDGQTYPGADDNASGVAVLLAAARRFVASRPRHTIVFAALDAEEAGLRGAHTLVASMLRRHGVVLNINLDMVARSASNEIYAAGTHHAPWQIPILQDVQRRTTVRIRFGHDRPATQGDGLEDWTDSSDHAAFHEAGIPFVYFGVEDHPDYHKPTDTVERIDPVFFGNVAHMILDAIHTFDRRLP